MLGLGPLAASRIERSGDGEGENALFSKNSDSCLIFGDFVLGVAILREIM